MVDPQGLRSGARASFILQSTSNQMIRVLMSNVKPDKSGMHVHSGDVALSAQTAVKLPVWHHREQGAARQQRCAATKKLSNLHLDDENLLEEGACLTQEGLGTRRNVPRNVKLQRQPHTSTYAADNRD